MSISIACVFNVLYVISTQFLFIRVATIFVSLFLSKPTLEHVTWSISTHMRSIHGFRSLPLMNQQRFDPPHNMTPHSSISTSTQHKYSLLHFYHGTSISKPSLVLHLRLVPQSSFLAIFTLLRHPQVISYHEPTLSIQLKSHNNHYP